MHTGEECYDGRQNVELIWAEIALIESSLGKIDKLDRIEAMLSQMSSR